ncbi:Mce protein [Mycobacterium asiaticum]|uniref:Mce protein n=1 Tax=Mycobacterium asiaticum TaxID=1790 RepID=A0A1A3NWD9_MYCAS|nr:Mce protein [Mycobacterium asiaticum]OBK24657.1 Mce protein [Mycobacterium asiaticum]
MEGDAGTSRLNPIDEDDSLTATATDEDSETTAAEAEPDASETEASEAAEAADVAEGSEESAEAPADEPGVEHPIVERRPSRVNRTWLAGVAALLLLAAGGIGAGGYFALRSHQEIQTFARNDAQALQIAKDCVAATQAPDTSSMAASEQKIIDCGTDQYRTQALLYSSMLVQAYQAANVHLQVSDMRAAVERNNPDGTVDILVALRVKVSNDEAQNQETGYRLRVKMTPTEGSYKISKLDQVTK